MVGHGGSSAGSYLANPTSPIPSHSASIVMTSTLRVNMLKKDVLFHERWHALTYGYNHHQITHKASVKWAGSLLMVANDSQPNKILQMVAVIFLRGLCMS